MSLRALEMQITIPRSHYQSVNVNEINQKALIEQSFFLSFQQKEKERENKKIQRTDDIVKGNLTTNNKSKVLSKDEKNEDYESSNHICDSNKGKFLDIKL